MKVKIAELKNNLSRYIHRVSDEGEVIIVCDRDRPVACISPLASTVNTEWHSYRESMLARAETARVELEIPETKINMTMFRSIRPVQAPDGRTDMNTIDLVRKDY